MAIPEEVEHRLVRHLLPLPKQIDFVDLVVLEQREIGVVLREGAGAIEENAAGELREQVVNHGVECKGEGGFEVHLGVDNPEFEEDLLDLRQVPNCEQAYLIRPVGNNRIVLTALSERGIVYAVRTLCQLLDASVHPNEAAVPLANVTDWPDLDERGMWNFPDPGTWIPWMSSLKLNYGKMVSTELDPIKAGKPNRARIDSTLMVSSRHRAFNYVPYIMHLNFLHDCDLFKTYPELAGVGEGALTGRYFAHKQGNQHRAPCASNPLLTRILSEWMGDIAGQGAEEVSCWLSERPGQCECRDCTSVGQFVLEARAFVAAWEKVRESFPKFRIRIFMSTTTTVRNYRILAELPPEVKLERACATGLERVTCLPRDLMANPLFDHYASMGRWIATYDVPIGAYGSVDTPETKVPHCSAHRIKDYVRQLVRRRYSGAYGMMAWATQGREVCGFNVSALAEWSWNSEGRTEKEFAQAWATREGYKDPEAIGEWAELMGPIEFDVYDSEFPVCYSWGLAAKMIRDKQRPYLGEGMFRYYQSVESFEEKKKICDRAFRVSERLEDAVFANETRVVRTYIELARCIYHVAELMSANGLENPRDQERMLNHLQELASAGQENTNAIRTWREGLGPGPWHSRIHDAIGATESTVDAISSHIRTRYIF
ncbi:MAG: hypothetical protein CME25_19360 [Gemmatimonadetes bacterium]|nr:hypothetical protein [Gemmatimonadota bacterium]